LLFAEDFEDISVLDRWVQAEGGAYIAEDPSGQRGRVLALRGCAEYGNSFSFADFPCSPESPCRISFWARGAPWQGFSRAWAHSWFAVPEAYQDGLLLDRLVGTKSSAEWTHYQYDFPAKEAFQMFGSAQDSFSTGRVHIMLQAAEKTGRCLETMFDDIRLWKASASASSGAGAVADAAAGKEMDKPTVSEYARWALARQPDAAAGVDGAPAALELGVPARPGGARRRAEAAPPPDGAAKSLRAIRGRIFSLSEKLKDLERGPPGLRWAPLVGKCLEQRFREHAYSICYFRTARQGSVSLGGFREWREPGGDSPSSMAKASHSMLFDGGQRCQAGPSRSLALYFVCGDKEELLEFSEPSRCAYEAQVSHPSACEPEDVRRAEHAASGAPLPPHDEL